jgi:hypothetical protein
MVSLTTYLPYAYDSTVGQVRNLPYDLAKS